MKPSLHLSKAGRSRAVLAAIDDLNVGGIDPKRRSQSFGVALLATLLPLIVLLGMAAPSFGQCGGDASALAATAL